ncbi:WD40-repeat-containing domain protein [Gymnopilus junonius]|uniref:WD40-repeat-containing domain protein n=1 Tax=Gymnopilus junonius TaxID=109634 RepID=A0A9P5NU74_GYMJU|nr:WD40-repeat-containing domain protein [Gymnopilus junonius]
MDGLNSDQVEEYKAWFKKSSPPPFRLARRFSVSKDDTLKFQSVAIFPFDENSYDKPELRESWEKLVSEYWDAVAVGSDYSLFVFFTSKNKPPLWVKLPEDEQKLLKTDKMCVAWSMASAPPWNPYIIFSRGSLLYVYDVAQKGIIGWIRGHGGAITSISVHVNQPNLFCTTSRDFTTRIYDLNHLVSDPSQVNPGRKANLNEVPNPHWPPGKKPSLAGAPHGLHLHPSESEGNGLGRCIIVLLGGRSGGHQAAVLGAAFHPVYPVIATCGLDRTVKIWPLRRRSREQITREDKPLFSSSMLHRARVLSVSWLQDDLLLTHSAPAVMRVSPDSKHDKRTYTEAGELVMWRWLGVDRFFSAQFEQEGDAVFNLRGCSSDYQESSSFKLISIHAFPAVRNQYIAPQLGIFQASPAHDTLILYVYPDGQSIYFLNAAHMKPRERPALPKEAEKLLTRHQDATGTALVDATGRMRLGGQEEADVEEETDDERLILRRPDVVVPEIESRKIDLREENAGRSLMACAIGMGGRVVVGVGSKGSIWVWRYDD